MTALSVLAVFSPGAFDELHSQLRLIPVGVLFHPRPAVIFRGAGDLALQATTIWAPDGSRRWWLQATAPASTILHLRLAISAISNNFEELPE